MMLVGMYRRRQCRSCHLWAVHSQGHNLLISVVSVDHADVSSGQRPSQDRQKGQCPADECEISD